MCEFISWIEKNDEVLFLTANDIFNTKRGRELQKHTTPGDFTGHGAIRFFYNNFTGGKDRECTDFRTPKNFPPQIVSAIKRLQFVGLGTPELLLSKTAWAEYQKIEQAARAEYEKIRQPAWAEYEKIQQTAWAEYEKIRQTARAEYEKIRQTAWAEYEKIRQPAWAEYQKIQQTAFWKLFKFKKNRNPAWR